MAGGGYPPYPPGYGLPPPGASFPGATPGPGPDRGSRLTAALVGGIVGAFVAAVVAAGLIVATDDDPGTAGATTTTLVSPGPRPVLDIQQLLDVARPSVVSIDVGFDASPGVAGAGTGFVVDAEEGLILTNNHVIEGADQITITFFDGSTENAEMVGSFPADDVAMVRVEGKDDLRAATLGSSSDLRVGEDVVAIGNALGIGGEPTVTTGIVSAKDRTVTTVDGSTLENLIQTDAAINPGNSGGPLLNSAGQVVGINTLGNLEANNIGFALAIDVIRPLIDELRHGDGDITPDQAVLGVTGLPVDDPTIPPELLEEFGISADTGVLIRTVSSGSGAEEAGLQEGDVIISIGGQTAENVDVVSEVVRSREPGDEVEVVYEREGEERTVTVTLGRRGG